MTILRQSTAVDVLIGPFVDSTDGDTEETSLTIAQASVLLSKNGQTLTQKNDDTSATHDADGYYNCELDATDTNTVGTLVLTVHVSGALAVRHEFQVIEEAIYDALYAGSATGLLPANVTQIEGSDPTDTIRDAVVDDATRIDASALNTATGTTIPAIETDTQDLQTQIGTAGAGLTDLGGMSTGMKAEVNAEADQALADYDAPTKSELDSGLAGLNDPTAAAIADAVWDEAATGHTDAGKAGEQLWTDVDAILNDTDLIDDATSGLAKIATDVAAVLVDTGTTLDGKINTIDGIVDDILLDTAEIGTAGAGLTEAGGTGDHLTAVPWNANWDAEVQSEVADALEATIADSIPSDGTRPSVKQALLMLTRFMFERSVSSTTVTVNKEDGTTSSFTLTLDDGTSPTSVTRAT